ncbi:MAG: tetratricopeptide repeat protein [Bacteroidales bacterium]|nr:tetratricopeptide repeat protein [Bacteroidales bacterium]
MYLRKNINFYLTIAIVLLFCVSEISAQKRKSTGLDNATLKEYFDDAQYFYDMGDYREALFNFLKIWDASPENANINYQIGMCYLNIPGEESKAIPYFEKAVKKATVDYDKNSFEETRAPLYAYYYLGEAYRLNNQPDKALEMYNRFRNHPAFENRYNARMVDEQIELCERAKIIFSNPLPVTFENVGTPINTSVNNYRPVLNSDETVMVFMTSLKFYEAVMVSKKVEGKWTEPVNITPQIGSDGDCEPTFLSADGKELYLVRKVKNNADLYVSTFDGEKWSLMKPLNKNINSSRNETSACLSSDGKVLYFSSDRRGGYGGLDIYKSERTKDGDWGSAVNLGKTINTEKNETNPYLSDGDKILIFASEGHLNMGGYDIFISQIAGQTWSSPVNIGYPVNSTGNDMHYYPVGSAVKAYTFLNRNDGLGLFDIYKISNPIIKYAVSNSTLRQDSIRRMVVRDRFSKDIIGYIFVLPQTRTQNTSNYLVE